jgi:hypothetical protein
MNLGLSENGIYIYIQIYPSLLAILIGKMTIDHQILEFSS